MTQRYNLWAFVKTLYVKYYLDTELHNDEKSSIIKMPFNLAYNIKIISFSYERNCKKWLDVLVKEASKIA